MIALKEKRPPPRKAIVRNAISQDVRAEDLAAVVFYLPVGLKGLLRRKEIRAGEEIRGEDVDAYGEIREGKVGSGDDVAEVVDEFQIFKTETMGETGGGEVRSHNVRFRIVFVLVWLEADQAAG